MIAAPEINVYKTPSGKKKLIFKYYFLFEDTVAFICFNFMFVLLLSFAKITNIIFFFFVSTKLNSPKLSVRIIQKNSSIQKHDNLKTLSFK